jgi:hypothetical protein
MLILFVYPNRTYRILDKNSITILKKGYWDNERVIIIGKVNLKFDPNDYPFKVKQVWGIEDLSEVIKRFKEVKLRDVKGIVQDEPDIKSDTQVARNEVIKSNGGQIKFIVQDIM